MKPSDKEFKCIEVSRRIREQIVSSEIERMIEYEAIVVKKNRELIILTPAKFNKKFGVNYSRTVKDMALWKNLLYLMVTITFYLIMVPVYFFFGILDVLFERPKIKPSLISQIKGLIHIHSSVTQVKTFSSLWNTTGLNDRFTKHFSCSDYVLKEQKKCIFKWVEILYGDTRRLDKLIHQIEEQQRQGAIEFYKTNPHSQSHVKMAPVEALLSEKIDKLYGHYAP